MPYIGRDLNRGNYLKLDDISSSFNSSTKTFNLTVGGSAFTPGSAFSILVSVGGVIQEPESAYQVNNSEITFANAPTAQDGFFCIALGMPISIGVPGNGTVNGTQIAKPFNYDGFFYLNDASNRVGINSSIPTASLDVIGDIKLNGSLLNSGGGGLQGNVYAASGISTFYDVRVTNNLTVEGTTTTLDTNLIGVDRVEVGANSNTLAGIAVTQSGTADLVRLYDGTSQVVTVDDTGNVGLGSAIPAQKLDVTGNIKLGTVQGTNTNANLPVLYQHNDNVIHGGSGLTYNPAEDVLTVNGADISANTFRGSGALGKLTCDNHSSTTSVNVSNTVDIITVDDAADAFTLKQGSNEYITVDTTNSSELITLGNTTTNPKTIILGGNFGIGTDSPVARLHVHNSGTTAADHAYAFFTTGDTGSTASDGLTVGVAANQVASVNYREAGTLTLNTSATPRITITSDGKIGIGTDNPGSFHGSHNDLVIGEGAGSAGLTIHSGSSSLGAIVFNHTANNSIPAQVGYSHSADELYFRTESTYKFEVGTTEVLNISGTGKVIKQIFTATNTYATNDTTQCGYQAQNLSDTTNTYAALRLTAGSSNPATTQLSSIRTGAGQNDFTIQLESSNTAFEALRITSGGDLYVNSSTALSSVNTAYRHISISNNAIFIAENSAGGFTGFTNNAYLNSSSNWVRVNNDHASVIGMDDGVLTYRKAGAGTGNITWEEGFRVDADGHFTTAQNATFSRTSPGFTARRGDAVQVTRAAGTPLEICRTTSEGAIIGFFNGSTNIGGFKISGNDLAYNRYVGGDAEIIRFDGDNLKVTTASDLEIGGVYKGPQDYPNVKPIFDFNFAKVKKLDSRFRCFRTGGASYVDEFGYIKIASYNAPRFDHDPITRECKGLLIEPSRENKISYSHAYSPSGTGTVDSYTEETRSPDGEYNAKKITRSASGGNYNEGTSTTGVFSVFLKAGSTNYVQIQGGGVGMNNSTIGPYTNNTVINLSNGTFTVNQMNFTAKQYRDGWWRVSVVYTTGSTYQGTSWSIYCLDSSSPNPDTVADGEHCYAWGQVFEVGSFITSYIPSGPSSQNTRGNENIRIGNTEKYNEFTDMFNAEEGTVITEHEILSSQANQGLVGFYKDFGSVDRIEVRATGTNTTRARFEVINTSSTVASMTNTSLAHSGIGINKNNKYAFAFKTNDYAGVVNGGSAQTDTSGNVPTGLNGMIVGNSVYNVRSHLYIKRLTLYSQRLSNNQMQNLTS